MFYVLLPIVCALLVSFSLSECLLELTICVLYVLGATVCAVCFMPLFQVSLTFLFRPQAPTSFTLFLFFAQLETKYFPFPPTEMYCFHSNLTQHNMKIVAVVLVVYFRF